MLLRRPLLGLAMLLTLLTLSMPASAVTVTVDSSKRYQTIDGFGSFCDHFDTTIQGVMQSDAFASMIATDMGESIIRGEVDATCQNTPDFDLNNLNLQNFNFHTAKLQTIGTCAQKTNARKLDGFKLYMSVWSPPAWLKTNGNTTYGGELIKTDYDAYGKYLAAFCIGFENTYGVHIDSISLQNELAFQEPYDSCVYYNFFDYVNVVKAVGAAFAKWGVTTRILGPEDVTLVYRSMGFTNGVQWDPVAAGYLSGFATHNYQNDGVTPSGGSPNWSDMRNQVQGWNKPMWQTETSGEAVAWPGAMDAGVNISDSMNYGNCSAYIYWSTLDPTPTTYSLTAGTDTTPKKYNAFKQYARYIRPGAVRIDSPGDTPTFRISSYIHDTNKTMTIAMANTDTNPVTVTLNLSTYLAIPNFTAYRTSASENFANVGAVTVSGNSCSVTLPAQSFVTLYGTGTGTMPASPSAPSNLIAKPKAGDVFLTWIGPKVDTSYNIKRSTVSGSGYANVATGITGKSYDDTTAVNGTVYYYVASGVNAAGESANSNQARCRPDLAQIAQTATAPVIDGNVDAIWSNAATYTLENNPTSLDVKAISGPSDCSATYQTMWDNNNIYFLITVTDDVVMANGDGIELFIDGDNSKRIVDWNNYDFYDHVNDLQYAFKQGSATITEYKLGKTAGVVLGQTTIAGGYRMEVSIPWTTIGVTPAANNLIGLDIAVDDSDVVATTRDSMITWSAIYNNAWVEPLAFGTGKLTTGGPQPPPAPTGLNATPGNAQVALTWNASTGATSYNVKRSTVNGSGYVTVASPTVTNYTNTGLTNGTTYYYVVTAVNANGESSPSAQVSGTPNTAPAPPTGLTATAGNTQVALSWTASGGATSYNALRSTVSGSGYGSVATGIAATSYTNTGLTNGTTYYFVVTATNSAGTSGNSAQASATPQPGVPAAPTNLTATGGNTQVALAWTASSGATSYNVLRSTVNGSGYVSVATGIATTSYTNTGLTNGTTYYFVVTATNTSGTSGNSNQASATPAAGGGGTLLASEPFGEASGALNGANGGTGWSAAWVEQNGSTTVPGYNVASGDLTYTGLSTSGNNHGTGGFAYEGSGRGVDISAGGPFGTNGYLTSGRIGASGKTLWFSALIRKDTATDDENSFKLHNGAGTGVWNPAPALAGMGYFGAASNNGATRYWSLLVAGTTYQTSVPITVGTTALLVMQIQFGATNTVSLYVNPSSLGGSAPAATITQTTTSSLAFQSLAYFGGNGASQSSIDEIRFGDTYAIVTPTSGGGGGIPAAPTGLTATPGNAQVALSWTASTGATSYNVKRSTVNGSGYVTVSSPTVTNYTNAGLTNGTTYYFVVTAVNASGESGNSNQASATPQPGAPPAPTGLTATPGNAQVALSWTASSGATSYNVQRSTVNGSGYVSVATGIVPVNYTNTGLTNGTTYYFVVTATNAGGTSGNSNQASATPTTGIPPAPTGLTATPGNTQVALSWTASSGATSYNILRSTVNGSGYVSVATGVAVTNYTNTGLTNGTTYYFVVTATNASGTSGNSNQASATPAAGGGGTLLASEPFGEAAGALNLANGNPSGWSGAWSEQNNSNTVPGYNVNAGTLTYTGLTTSGNKGVGGFAFESAGRGFDLNAGGPFGANGYLAASLIGASGKTIWISALIRKDTNTDEENSLRLTNSNTVWLLGTPQVGVGYFGVPSNTGSTRYWSINVNGTVIKSNVQVTVSSTTLLVARIDFAATSTVTLYVNPTSLGGSAPGTSNASTTSGSSLAFRSLCYMGGNGAGASSVDEIRLGDTYAAVTQ